MAKRLFLASTSPRRRRLLAQLGIAFEPLNIAINERMHPDETPRDYVLRMARGKAIAGRDICALGHDTEQARYLGADTIAVHHGRVLGKPPTPAHARDSLRRLSGDHHQVLTAMALVDENECNTALSTTTVYFRALSDHEIDAYIATGEGLDKAGAYAIQGQGGAFVSRIDGSYSGVVGLALCETALLLNG